MQNFKILLVLICCTLISCTATKPLTSHVTPDEITDLKLLEPYSYISMIKKGNKSQLDDSVSYVAKQLNIQVLNNMIGRIPISGEIFLTDEETNKTLEKEYELLMLTADRNKNISNLKITPALDKILEANETRFGLIIITSGFTRAKGNYGKQVAKGAAMGLLTLGMYYQVPVKSYSAVYAMVVDSKEDNIAFFRKSFLQDLEPVDPGVLSKQYHKLFEGYFLNKQP